MKLKRFSGLTLVLALACLAPTSAFAGKVFITGHDPDFHAQDSAGAAALLETGLNYVTNGTWNGGTQRFLWVESFNAATSGHRVGEDSLLDLGLVQGLNFDWVDAAAHGPAARPRPAKAPRGR